MRLFTLVLGLSATVILSCSDHESPVTEGRVEFFFSLKERVPGDPPESTELEYALVQLQNETGTSQTLKLPLEGSDTRYYVASVPLVAGEYKITQFALLNNEEKIRYATPLEGSELAVFVEDPLPYFFTVVSGELNTVDLDVLSIEDEDIPEDFGFVRFTISGVDQLTMFQLPDVGEAVIRKISYTLYNNDVFIKKELDGYSRLLDLDQPELIGTTWQTRVMLWVESDGCLQHVYIFRGEIKFDGRLVKLPEFEHWQQYYHSNLQRGVQAFLSTDPRDFNVEFEFPSPTNYFPMVYLDLWGFNDQYECGGSYYVMSFRSGRVASIHFDPLDCESSDGMQFDNLMMLYDQWEYPMLHAFSYFLWELKDGVVTPVNCGAGFSAPDMETRRKSGRFKPGFSVTGATFELSETR